MQEGANSRYIPVFSPMGPDVELLPIPIPIPERHPLIKYCLGKFLPFIFHKPRSQHLNGTGSVCVTEPGVGCVPLYDATAFALILQEPFPTVL